MIIRIRYRVLGSHVHCRVFTARATNLTFASAEREISEVEFRSHTPGCKGVRTARRTIIERECTCRVASSRPEQAPNCPRCLGKVGELTFSIEEWDDVRNVWNSSVEFVPEEE